MRCLVIAYPTLSPSDFEQIQAIRETNDPQFSIVRPHLTLIFGTEKLTAPQLTEHVAAQANELTRIAVRFNSIRMVPYHNRASFQVFLVPSDGYQALVALHDKLYTDTLASELRPDIPFIPHVAIGGSAQEDAMRDLAANLTTEKLDIHGLVEALTIVEFDGSKLTDYQTISLA